MLLAHYVRVNARPKPTSNAILRASIGGDMKSSLKPALPIKQKCRLERPVKGGTTERLMSEKERRVSATNMPNT